MRVSNRNQKIKCRAIAGSHVVMLAWDFINAPTAQEKNVLMGFSIERAEIKNNAVVEKYFLRGIKRFFGKDKGLAPGSPVSTAEHPVQSFQWCDYTAKPGVQYEYTVTSLTGTVKNLKPQAGGRIAVRVTTEPETDITGISNKKPRHDVYFNRGVIGSQAYAREFENREPDRDNPGSPEMKWLSRGLYEALIRFIGLAKDGYALRACFYEFHYVPVANAFAKAIQDGADVKIVYDGESEYKVENLATIKDAGLDHYNAAIPRTVSAGIRHNKFIVLINDKGKPIGVWTGSTNISAGGIFGHSNVGHVVWDNKIAQSYLDYWDRLAKNVTPTKIRKPNRDASPLPNGKPPKNSVTPLFSARDDDDSNDTLQWYADRMADAKQLVCFTVAFNIDEVFQKVLNEENNVLRYVVKDDDLADGEIISTDRDVIFAAGAYLGKNSFINFLGERGNPLNRNDYIHDKFMLVDPLGDDPLVITGSANFSKPSQRTNDENMLVIRGDTRVADIYFGEFMRMFDHHYARYLARKFADQGTQDPNVGYLKDDPKDWVTSHFNNASYKAKRRKYFAGK